MGGAIDTGGIVYQHATRALIVRDDEILLLRETNRPGASWAGRWVTPGGRVEAGESLEQCVMRECFEETGLTVVPEKIVGFIEADAHINGATHRIMRTYYECKLLLGKEIRLSDEHDSWCWFAFAGLTEIKMSGADRNMFIRLGIMPTAT